MNNTEQADELRKIFTIACNTYGLNPQQLWHINHSMDIINDVVFNFKQENYTLYVEHYNILAKLMNNVQTAGNVFNLEDAGKVFKSLNTIKEFIETKELTDNLDTSYEFIKTIINKCFFSDLIYSFDQISKLSDSISIISGMYLEKYRNINLMETLAFIREMIELAQNKGRFSLDQANSIIQIINDIKKNIIRLNVEREKEKEKEKEKKEELDLGINKCEIIEQEVAPKKRGRKGKKKNTEVSINA